jgi:hypothetical protein
VANFSATSDGHGGTLITDPPIASGDATDARTGPLSGGLADVAPGGGTTVHSGGYELVGGDAPTAEAANKVFFSSGGMMQVDSLLSQFAGVISGFDLGDEIGLRSLGFGSAASTISWMHEPFGTDAGAPGINNGGNIFNLTLLGQYSAAHFSAGADGHGGALFTDLPASNSIAQTPSVTHQRLIPLTQVGLYVVC